MRACPEGADEGNISPNSGEGPKTGSNFKKLDIN